jgi:hypothetical protein
MPITATCRLRRFIDRKFEGFSRWSLGKEIHHDWSHKRFKSTVMDKEVMVVLESQEGKLDSFIYLWF